MLNNRGAHDLRDRLQARGLRDRILLSAQIAAEDRRRSRSDGLQPLFRSKRNAPPLDAVKVNCGRLTLALAGRGWTFPKQWQEPMFSQVLIFHQLSVAATPRSKSGENPHLPMKLDEITTPGLRLVPFDKETARAVLAGELEGIKAGEGWPHQDTFDGLSMAAKQDEPPVWMVTLDETVIGDCGTHGGADENGVIEIGYGLAEPFRRRSYGTELVGAMTEWLLARPGIQAVRASTLADNAPSRRVLEKNGFSLTGYDEDGQAVYQRR